jgi:GH25 family lysozyme M1 (1,4-beta-N-acetylmuramidase)
MLEGFDASGFSGDIDCYGARAAGKHYAIFRVGRGIADGATDMWGFDRQWRRNKDNAIAAGLPVGGYWRFFPSVGLIEQISKFVSALNQSPGMLQPWVDIEDTGGLNPHDLTNWAIEVLSRVEEGTGWRPILYTGKNFLDTRLEYWRLDRWQQAIAWQKTDSWGDYGSIFWQYLLDTNVPWARGRVDLQKFALNTTIHHQTSNELLYWFDDVGLLHGPLVHSGKLLPEAGRQGTQSARMGIVHTMVGYLNGTDSYFRRADIGLESTFGIGGKYDGAQLDGAIYQWTYILDRADANGAANGYAASWETSDGGGERYRELWSPKQEESIAQSMAAYCYKFNVPPALVSRAHSSQRGLAYHRQGIDPWRNPGDDSWSPDGGKVCPGFERSQQFQNTTIPRIRAILESLKEKAPEPQLPELDMNLSDVVGVTRFGRTVTVRDALLRVMDLEDPHPVETDPIIQKIDKVLRESRVSHSILVNQPTWDDVSEMTWDQLSAYRWGDIKV